MTDTQPSILPPDQVTEIQTAMSDRSSPYWRGERGSDGNTSMQSRYASHLKAQEAAALPAALPPFTQKDSAELGAIHARMSDPKNYVSDPAVDARYRSLVAARDAAASRPPNPELQRVKGDMEALKAKMADRHSDYWTGPTAETNQARYRELTDERTRLEAQESAPAPLPPGPVEPAAPTMTEAEFAATDAGKEIQAEIDRLGGTDAAMKHGATVAAQIDAIIPVEDQAAFAKNLESLPVPLKAALRAEVWSPPPISGPASAAQLARFGATEEGSILLAEWGAAAPAKVAIIRAHVARLQRRVGNPAAVAAWGLSMSAATRAALCRELTASV